MPLRRPPWAEYCPHCEGRIDGEYTHSPDCIFNDSDRTVVVTPYGRRFHRIREGERLKHAACGGFNQTNLSGIPISEALEQGYTPCQNCNWDFTEAIEDGGDGG